MTVSPVKTDRITASSTTLIELLDKHLPALKEQSIIAITSKVASLCEGRVVKVGTVTKEALIAQEADYYLKPDNQHGITLSITKSILIPTAGIDESNGDGYYILWPEDAQKTANEVREHLAKKHQLHDVGVIITDSKTTPLRRGTSGIALAHSGFLALRDYIGQPDLFGTPLKVTKANLIDGLAATAVLAMGEGNEQTPLVKIGELSGIVFQERNPNKAELDELQISLEDDLYAPLLKGVPWQTKNTA